MTATNYLKMTYSELQKEIDGQNRKIKNAKETISLLTRLQETAKRDNEKIQQPQQQHSGM